MNDQKNIKDKVIKIKKFLDLLKDKYLRINYHPLSQFDEKESYPLDFQIFMEQIGELSIGSKPRKEYSGYAVLEIMRPRTLDHMKEKDFEEDAGELPFFWYANNYETSLNTDIFKGKISVGDVHFVAIEPCANNSYGFIKDNSKYYFTSDEFGYAYKYDNSNQNSVFLNWFIVCLIEHVDYICSDKVKTLEEYKKLKEKAEN